VTICVDDRQCHFGTVVQGDIVLSEMGEAVKSELLKIPEIYPNATIDFWVIMPNHIHLILAINKKVGNGVETRRGASLDQNSGDCKETRRGASLLEAPQQNKFSPLVRGSLSSIINHFKGRATKAINRRFSHINFHWQTRFYDHIIRDEYDMDHCRDYIFCNSGKWYEDEENPENKKINV